MCYGEPQKTATLILSECVAMKTICGLFKSKVSTGSTVWLQRMHINQFETNGIALIEQLLSNAACQAIDAQLAGFSSASVGTRCLLSHAWCRELAAGMRQNPSLAALVPSDLVAVQCTYFEKSLARNWLVPIHQDMSIPVAQRIEHHKLQGWSEKEGSLYVQAPVEILQQLVAVRLHLDACGVEDGALRVIPGSHLAGRISAEAAAIQRQTGPEFVCTAQQGSAWVMCPLLLHASSKSKGKNRRRVLHFLFGPREIPYGLAWQQAV